MKKSLVLCMTVLFLMGCGGSSSSTKKVEVVDSDGFESLRTIAQSQLNNSIAPAVSIAIYKDGEIVFAEAFGLMVKYGSSPVNENTLFQLGSTTKMYTALGALRLIENSSLSLDSALINELPDIQLSEEQRPGWQQINVHHLLTHQGGFTDYVDFDNDSEALEKIALSTYPNQFDQMNPAGKFFNYSNPNWSYLGAIIERQTSLTYQQAMEQTVFAPLGMTRTTMEESSLLADGNYALGAGFIVQNGETKEGHATQLNEIHKGLFGTPAGSYTWSTPSEMLKMANFLMHGDTDVLSDELRTEITARQVELQHQVPANYGYGVFIQDIIPTNSGWLPIKRWDHGGNTLAYTSQFWILPEENIAVAILRSGQNTDFSNTMIAALKSVMTLPAAVSAPIKPIDTDSFDDHVGRYEGFFGVVDIFLENEKLHMSVPAFDAEGTSYDSELQAIGGTVFTVTVDGETPAFTFIADVDGGKSTYIRTRDWVAIRNDDAADFSLTASTPKAKLAPMVPAELKRYTIN